MTFEKEGNVGTICLNNPKALNAINLEMIRLLYPTLKVHKYMVCCNYGMVETNTYTIHACAHMCVCMLTCNRDEIIMHFIMIFKELTVKCSQIVCLYIAIKHDSIYILTFLRTFLKVRKLTYLSSVYGFTLSLILFC